MQSAARSSGIPAVGDIPWGTHFCQFYRSESDLTETLVPYFEAGLRANESCLWVTSEKLEAEKAAALMIDAVPDFKKYLSSGQMEIISIADWYVPGAVFDARSVLQGWIEKENASKAKGFTGLRLTGDTFWVDRSGWENFMDYERLVNKTFRSYNLVALCTYCMDKCSADDVIDVCCEHQFALARRGGNWELMESSSLKIAKEHLHHLNQELENRVKARTAQLKSALRARDEFLAMLGHELRNPLAPIRSATEVIRSVGSANPLVNSSTEILDRQIGHLTRLVDDLLDVGRITQGRIKLGLKDTSLSEVLELAVELSRPLIDQRRHSLSVQLPSRHVKVKADPTRLAQVFGNLLHNAAKYTPDGGSVSIGATINGDRVVVSVKDTGIGIPKSMLVSIFDLFAQVPRSLARSEGGLGIGLTLAKRLTEMHGGEIRATSEGQDKGAEFLVELPLLVDTALQAGCPSAASLNETVLPSNIRVLVIDDNRDANDSLACLLTIAGHTVMSAYDGLSGASLAKSFQPTVVLLDIGLPGIDGYEVARRLRNDPITQRASIIALTGYGQAVDLTEAHEVGFDSHFLKPAKLEDLLKQIALLSKATLN